MGGNKVKQYKEFCNQILELGNIRGDRTGTGTISRFGLQMEYDLQEGFPLLTTKDMKDRLPSIIHELLWFLKGDTHIRYLVENGVGIWNPDAHRVYKSKGGALTLKEFRSELKKNADFLNTVGELGPVYGKQWRSWGNEGIDQIADIMDQLQNNPESRRILVNAWNVSDLKSMALPPCHVLFQFYVSDGKLDCKLYQRSGDTFLGVPFNIASYALLTMMVAKVVGLEPGRFIHTFGDAHIYLNHVDQVKEQLSREEYKLPQLNIDYHGQSLFDFKIEDFELVGYEAHPEIKGSVSVG
jgi:thymidylate synthase